MDTNNEQLKKLSRIFNADKLVTPEDIVEVLKGIKNIMDTFKKDNIALTEEAKFEVSELFAKVQSSHEEMLAKTKNLVEEAKGKVSNETKKALVEIKKTSKKLQKMIQEVELIQPRDGKDADEEKIVNEVLSKIKLPEHKESVLDAAEIIVKINELDTDDDDFKIDAKHIKNLPQMAMNTVNEIVRTGLGNLEVYSSNRKIGSSQRIRFTGATVTQDADGAIKVAITSGTGGGHTIQDEGTPVTQRTNLNFVGTGVTVTDDVGNDATVVTISGASVNFADNETPSGDIDGLNKIFVLANTPSSSASLQLFLNGQFLTQNVDYTILGDTITMTTAPDILFASLPFVAFYRY